MIPSHQKKTRSSSFANEERMVIATSTDLHKWRDSRFLSFGGTSLDASSRDELVNIEMDVPGILFSLGSDC